MNSPSRFSSCPGERALARAIHEHCDDDGRRCEDADPEPDTPGTDDEEPAQ